MSEILNSDQTARLIRVLRQKAREAKADHEWFDAMAEEIAWQEANRTPNPASEEEKP